VERREESLWPGYLHGYCVVICFLPFMCFVFSYNSSISSPSFCFLFRDFFSNRNGMDSTFSCFCVLYCVYLGVCMRESDLFAGLGQ